MTSSPLVSAGIPRRREAASALRRTSEIVLVAGTVVAVIAAFGPPWAVRTGVAVAVAAAVVACLFAWRELFAVRREHAATLLRVSTEHGRQLSEERGRTGAVIETLRNRVADAGALIDRQRITIAELKIKVSALRGDKVYLRGEVDHRETVISSLRETVRAREAELVALRSEDNDADVHTMPRRHRDEQAAELDEITAMGDLWTDGSHPTVFDLKVIDAAMVLPNYEAERQVG